MKKIYIDLCHTLVQQLADRVAYTSISRSKFDVLCKTYSRYQSNAFNADLFNEIFNAWNPQDLLAKDSNQALPFRLPPITYKNDQVNTPSYASAQFTLAPTTPLTGEEPINFVKYWLIISYFHQWGHEQMEHSNFDLTMCNVVSQVVLESINKYSKKFNADVTGTSESWPIIRFYHKQTQQLLMLAQNTYENFIQSLQRHIVFSNCIKQFFYQTSHYLERSLRCYENQRLKNHNQQIILKLKKTMHECIKKSKTSTEYNCSIFENTKKTIIQALDELISTRESINAHSLFKNKPGQSQNILNTIIKNIEQLENTHRHNGKNNAFINWCRQLLTNNAVPENIYSDPETCSPPNGIVTREQTSYSLTLY